jgi:hypothetical protein
MSNSPANSMPPVLVVAFNRPKKLAELLTILEDVGVSRLYVVIDGPRPHNESDKALVTETIAIAESATWAPELIVKARPQNLGCGLSPADAIGGVLKKESAIIILEDDCRPSRDFFEFMRQGLSLFKDDSDVGAICGTSYVPVSLFGQDEMVWVSTLFSPWGWGTWSRAWRGFSSKSSEWATRTSLLQRFAFGGLTVTGLRWLEANWRWLAKNDPEGQQVWDHLFGLLLCEHGQVVLKPTVNLVTNIGYGPDATHDQHPNPFSAVKAHAWQGSVADWPRSLKVNRKADRWILKHHYQAQPTIDWLGELLRAGLRRATGWAS